MSSKYQKFGFRRDKNLSDSTSGSAALGNLLDNLPTVGGESFVPNDLYVINGIRNTNVSNSELKSLANIREIYLNPETNTIETVRPLVNLKDRVDNFKIFTEDPIFGSGGNGPNVFIVPLSNLNNISKNTKGDQLFINDNRIVGPINFWDDGNFILDNRLFPTFNDPYGLVQWNGYFAKELFRETNTITYRTTGLMKIEENILDNSNSWYFLKNIYSDSIPVEIQSDGEPSDTYNVGNDVICIAINHKISGFENVSVISVDTANQSITLSEPITLNNGTNVVNFVFEIGLDELEFSINPFSSFLNDKIKTRMSLWWPNVNNPTLSKTLFSQYFGLVNDFNFSYFYKTHDRKRLPESEESIDFFLRNRLSGTNEFTKNNIINLSSVSSLYTPPKLLSEKILFPTKNTVINNGVGRLSGSNRFTNAIVGDWILIRPTNVFQSRAYQITEKINNSTVFIKYDAELPVGIGETFDISIVKNLGLVGIFYFANNTVFEFGNMNFLRRKIKSDYLCMGLSDTGNNNTNFLRINNFNTITGNISVSDFQSGGQSLTNGIIIVYQDKGIIDESKVAFCTNVIGKETTQIANQGQNTLILNNVASLQNGLFVQLSGFIPSNTTIVSINGNTITLSNTIIKSIPLGSSIVFSPDNVNREICIVPLNTAPPFEGTIEGLKTSTLYPGIWVNDLEFKNLNLTLSNVSTIGATTTYSSTINFKNNSQNYRILLR